MNFDKNLRGVEPVLKREWAFLFALSEAIPKGNYALLFAFFVASRPKAGPPTSRPGGLVLERFSLRSLGVVGSDPRTQRSAPEVLMPAIASLEDLKAAQKELLVIL